MSGSLKEKNKAKSKIIEKVYYDFYNAILDVSDDQTIKKEFGQEVLDMVRWTGKEKEYRRQIIKRVKDKEHSSRIKEFVDLIENTLSKM